MARPYTPTPNHPAIRTLPPILVPPDAPLLLSPRLPPPSDDAFDALKQELQELQQQLEAIAGPSTHTTPLSVGAPPAARLGKVQHALPMLSLVAAASKDAVLNWYSKLTEQAMGLESVSGGWVVEPKVDGLAIGTDYGPAGLNLPFQPITLDPVLTGPLNDGVPTECNAGE